MDYDKLRKYLIAKIYELTMKWNEEEEIYPVKPPNLSEAQQTIWTVLTTHEKLKNLSETESRAFRDMAVEVLGTKLPDTSKDKKIKSVPPYVVLSVPDEMSHGCARSGEQLIMKMSGIWASTRGATCPFEPFNSKNLRLPTLEEVEDVVKNVPDEYVCLSFAGILPIKGTPEVRAKVLDAISSTTVEFFGSRPQLDMSEEDIKIYKMAAGVDNSAVKLMFALVGREWNGDTFSKISEYENSKPELSGLVSVTYDGKTYIMIGKSSAILKDKLMTLSVSSWDDISQPEPAHIEKALKSANLALLYPYLPIDLKEELLKEVQFE